MDNDIRPAQRSTAPQTNPVAVTDPATTQSPPLQQTVSTPKEPAPKRKEGWRNVGSTLLILLIAPLIAVMLTAFVFQSYQVSGPSMQTTLNNNDRLIVWKLPRTWARITHHAYIPKRGDVVIFVADNVYENKRQLIKRVVALPGEKVAIKDGKLLVYNQAHPDGYQPDTTLPYGNVITTTLPESDQTEWTVGKDEVFVCGDNRTNSQDSRTFGPVPAKDIVGKLAMRVLPLNQAERF